jgi:hypothetical protein
MLRPLLTSLILTFGAVPFALAADEAGFKRLDDGKSFAGWKANENAESWKIEDGAFVAHGPRSHLFYVGDEKPFVDFELKVDVKTEPHSNGGIYFHSRYQESGWPKYGFEAQVNNTYDKDPRKSGSLYQVQDVAAQKVQDDEWYTETVIVRGKRVIIKLNDETVVDYTEPEGQQPGKDFTRVVGAGTFALQAHDPESTVRYKNIRVKRLD